MSAVWIWTLCGLTLAAVAARPFRIPEWCWSLLGAAALVISGLLPVHQAALALQSGLDVYLFLTGMLALAETARTQGLFEWLAKRVTPAARGSQRRLFAGTYVAGVGVTALLSNDATIVLLTPAVLAAVRQAGANPLPYVFACAFVANAASFLLPIGNPANLLVFRTLPGPAIWFQSFGVPALVAIVVTYEVLALLFRNTLAQPCSLTQESPALGKGAKAAAVLVPLSALFVLTASALHWPVGLCAFVGGVVSLATVGIWDSRSIPSAVRHAQWSIVALVAGLFVIVQALDATGVLNAARTFLIFTSRTPAIFGDFLTGFAVTAGDTIFNNLPVGVVARYAAGANGVTAHIVHATLIGVDLGPNLSVTGSLATLLWLAILRRERVKISLGQFFRLGAAAAIPALFLSLLFVR